jgi:hypothetical protein
LEGDERQAPRESLAHAARAEVRNCVDLVPGLDWAGLGKRLGYVLVGHAPASAPETGLPVVVEGTGLAPLVLVQLGSGL